MKMKSVKRRVVSCKADRYSFVVRSEIWVYFDIPQFFNNALIFGSLTLKSLYNYIASLVEPLLKRFFILAVIVCSNGKILLEICISVKKLYLCSLSEVIRSN